MNKSILLLYLEFIAILTIPAIFIGWYSFHDDEIEIVLQKADIASYFNSSTSVLPTDSLALPAQPAQDSIVCDTLPQRILFFGDSMLEGLSKRMRQYAAENDHELLNVIWYSSSSKVWAEHIDTLAYFIRTFEPTYIMICMGGNELFVKDINKRDAYVKTILQKVGDIPYVWIGPPNWKEDTGINQVFEDNVGAHRYFLSKKLSYKRNSDGAHPTTASAAMWMDSVAFWMHSDIRHRILMELPQSETSQKGKTVLLKPLK